MTEIQLHDTLSRGLKRLVPGADGRIGVYVCGPTVYDRAHIGNARAVVVFDALHRLLRHLHGDRVRFVHNITDIDDKILARADATGRPIRDITEETLGWYLEDMDSLGWLRPTVLPRCTEHIPQMVAMTETLIAQGHAYAAEGHVLFAVESWNGYGALSRRSVDEMVAGARVEVAPYKKNPMDFVIWKPSTPEQPGWESPWGRGRPGWHIECSAMAKEHLGERFQVHGGGVDLVFPHHENERAQSCCANATAEMAEIWMHNGFLTVEGEKMSKSLGNFFTVADLRARGVPGEVIRFVLLSTHYRQPLDWTESRVAEAEATLRKWRGLTDGAAVAAAGEADAQVLAALADDLNTPKAIARMHELHAAGQGAALAASAAVLGLLTPALGDWAVRPTLSDDDTARVAALLARRKAARAEKDFATADLIRDRIAEAGIAVKDLPGGAWEAAPTPTYDPAKLAQLEDLL